MLYQIYAGDMRIGSSNLNYLDPWMGIANGTFLPSEHYQSVQPVFRLYAEAGVSAADQDLEMLDKYYRERDALDLTVRTQDGEPVPLQCVHIEDFLVELGEITITVAASDSHIFHRYFESNADMAAETD